MLLHHVTTKTCVPSIRKSGLRPAYSRGKMRAVWFASTAMRAWALGHVGIERGYTLEKLVILTVRVPRGWLRRRRRGIWMCCRDVPPGRIVSVSTVEVFRSVL